MNAGPLGGIRVADFSRVLSGPWCTMTLADLGADVVKVERPGEGDETRGWGPPFAGGEAAYFLSTNRGKRSIALDLRREDHREVARRLVDAADVLVENFRPGTMERLGFGEQECRARNPGLVYASISGFGLDGPARDDPGYDFIIQGRGGLMSITGSPASGPMKAGVAISDITAGLYSAIGIVAALRQRDRTGHGPRVHVSLLGAQVSWLANQASNYLVGGLDPTRMGNAHPNIVPYQVFHASDRSFVLAVANETIWGRFCSAIGRPELRDDARFARNRDRVEHRTALVEDLARVFAARTRDAWIEAFAAAQVPCGPINTVAEVFQDEAVRALGMVQSVAHPSAGELAQVRAPIDVGGRALPVRRPPPTTGQHTEEILRVLGYDDDDVASMLAEAR